MRDRLRQVRGVMCVARWVLPLRLVGAIAWVVAVSATSASAVCPGDCNGDRVVGISELVLSVNIALGRADIVDCAAADANADGRVRISDLIAAVNAALAACPPEDTPTPTPVATATATVVNLPPSIATTGVYRSHPGLAIEYPIEAVDPEGGALVFSASDLPPGSSLDAGTGVFSWTPTEAQAGAYEIPIRCTDDRGQAVDGMLAVRITPADPCTVATCGAATGCSEEPMPIGSGCCVGEPAVRVPEPSAECMPGLVMYAGRNERGFGRMQNCDLLQVRPFGQGSANVRFHIEARCISAEGLARLNARLEIDEAVIFDRDSFIQLDEREDGFAQELALIYELSGAAPSELDGREAQLSLSLTDSEGVEVERVVRVTLTTSSLGDLPEPDREDIPAGEAGCVGCHRPLSNDGSRFGIEDAHPWAELTCTDCHGGNPAASTRGTAHVPPGDGPSYVKNLASDQLDALSLDYLRFVNPGDLRVADQTCGAAGCHPEHVANVPKSVMSTYAAHYTLPRYLAGAQDRDPILAAVDIVDLDFDAETAPVGAIPELRALRGASGDRSSIVGVLDEYLPKACPTCHLQTFGTNDSAGSYRSSGCTACHMVYADDGLSESRDPMIAKSFPSHPVTHQLTTAIPVEQCAHCHFQGGRIGLAFRGIREGGFPPEQTPPLGQTLGTPLYGHDENFYFSDEDVLNNFDETPPDLHFSAGMVCMDCHVGADVHGDGNLYRSERYQTGIRCEDCHGTVRAAIVEDEEGVFRNSAGFALKRLERDELGTIRLRLAMTGAERPVTQVHERLNADVPNPRMVEAMGVNEGGFSHTDSMECYTCHTSWRQTCFGCHVTIDDRRSARNNTTGESTVGAISAHRDDYALDFYALGLNERGKISPLCSSMSMFFSYIDPLGSTLLDDEVRTSSDGKLGFGWNPFHHHTVTRIPQNCDRCHAVGDSESPENDHLLRETYGFGRGDVVVEDGRGDLYDATAFLDEDGDLRSDFAHPNTGPVPRDVRERASELVVVPHPR